MKTKIASLFAQYNIKSISCDSRNIKPESAFFAIRGLNFDGNLFISEALEKGSIVFTDELQQKAEKVFYVSNIRIALAMASGILYPKLPKNLIAVTGTNGKSSVVSYIYQILKLLGFKAATIGTLGLESTIKMNESFFENLSPLLTTPDPIVFRRILNELTEIGIDNLAFEASSHGIYQNRLGDVKVKTAGFTSFSQDHLDYHKNMDDYLKTKLQLFVDNLEEGGEVVINSEILELSPYSAIVKDFLREKRIRYFLVGKAGDIRINNIKTSLTGSEVDFEYDKKNYRFNTSIIGSFQATNLLIATKIVANLSVDFNQIIENLQHVTAVTGRLQRIGNIEDDFQIFVDYAHTPDALERSLLELQKIKVKNGKLYLVFGCGGERDKSKRVLMGKVACKLADYIVVTDDNPRGEDPKKIRLDILKGLNRAEEIDGRELAIEKTIAKLNKNDILLIAGKGHEECQIIGNKTLLFSDIETARKLLILNKNNFKK
ncbi:MAG: UDP-N-acetylmuramoyl-L-alanyl-D-glutamate--2,6-diaminopimelate ligase [Rickettsiaceae bacterium]